jgi:hypothetical protein
MNNNAELNYQLNVQPAIFAMMRNTQDELLRVYNISADDFERAVWTWAMEKLVPKNPLWMVHELARMKDDAQRQNTIEGEVGE